MSQKNAPAGGRRQYLDWLRGVGVLVMIQGHVVDSWTQAADRASPAYGWIMLVGGLGGAPVFLFLAGVALALAAGARIRSGRTEAEAAALARTRGWQIFALAFLFRLQSWIISGGEPERTLLKVDILNIMGPSIVLAATLWGLFRTSRARIIAFGVATVAIVLLMAGAAGVRDLLSLGGLIAGALLLSPKALSTSTLMTAPVIVRFTKDDVKTVPLVRRDYDQHKRSVYIQ